MNTPTMNMQAGGVVTKAVLAGSADPEKYMKRCPRQSWKQGGYGLQMSPHDIAALVNHARPQLKGKRMLCIGVETLGAERFIAEQLGIISVDVVYSQESKTTSDNMVELIRAGVHGQGNGEVSGNYDLITLFGDGIFSLPTILKHAPIGSQIAVLGISPSAALPDLRRLWLELRRKYTAILQTVDNYDLGVGLVKIEYKEESNGKEKHVPIWTRKENPQPAAAPASTSGHDADVRELGGTEEAANVGTESRIEAKVTPAAETPKRKGRPKGSKNPVKA